MANLNNKYIFNSRLKNKNKELYQNIKNQKRKDMIRLFFTENHAIAEAARMLKINYPNVRKIIKLYESKLVEKKKKGGSEKRILNSNITRKIDEIVPYQPELTLREIKRKIEGHVGNEFTISESSVCRCFEDLRITLKLAHREIEKVNEPDKIQQRKQYSLWFNNYFNNDFLGAVFIDETEFNLHLRRSYTRAK